MVLAAASTSYDEPPDCWESTDLETADHYQLPKHTDDEWSDRMFKTPTFTSRSLNRYSDSDYSDSEQDTEDFDKSVCNIHNVFK